MSPETLLSPQLPAGLAPAPPERVLLEITEHAQGFDDQPVARRLRGLRDEGVETEEDRDALEVLGVTAAQGCLLGRPEPLPEAAAAPTRGR